MEKRAESSQGRGVNTSYDTFHKLSTGKYPRPFVKTAQALSFHGIHKRLEADNTVLVFDKPRNSMRASIMRTSDPNVILRYHEPIRRRSQELQDSDRSDEEM